MTTNAVIPRGVDIKQLLQTVHERLLRHIRFQPVAMLAEARCAWRLMSEMEDFVYSAEGATFDAGVIVPPREVFIGSPDPTERLVDALDQFQGQNVVLPVDFKTIAPSIPPWWNGPLYRYAVGLTDQQRKCALIVVVNPSHPHLVAAVPPKFVSHCLREVPYTDADVEPFPMELSPFVMPVTFLAQAIRAAVQSYLDPDSGYHNPYNDVLIKECPIPSLVPVESLLTTPGNKLTDWKEFRVVWQAFRDFSTKFRVERVMVSGSGTGDFFLVHIETGVRAAVEMKRGDAFWEQQNPPTIGHLIDVSMMRDTPIFHPTSPWDYLLSIGRERAFFVSRDQIPVEWFTTQPLGEHHSYRTTQEYLDLHLLEWGSDRASMNVLVVGMEKVLEAQLRLTGGLQAVREVPFVVPDAYQVTRYWSRIDPEKKKEPLAKDGHRDRGTVQYGSKQVFRARQAQVLAEQCVRSSFGAVLRNGYHPVAWYNFALGSFDPAYPVFFADLPLESLFVYVNFAAVTSLDLIEPVDMANPSEFFHLTHGEYTCFFALVPHPRDLEGHGLNWMVVSSNQVEEDDTRSEYNANVLKHGWRETRKNLRLRLRDDESIRRFQVSSDEVPHLFERLLRQWVHEDADASDSAIPHDAVDMQMHVVSKYYIIQEFAEQAVGRSLWAHRLKTLQDVEYEVEDEE